MGGARWDLPGMSPRVTLSDSWTPGVREDAPPLTPSVPAPPARFIPLCINGDPKLGRGVSGGGGSLPTALGHRGSRGTQRVLGGFGFIPPITQTSQDGAAGAGGARGGKLRHGDISGSPPPCRI